jgi:hypothetical protein
VDTLPVTATDPDNEADATVEDPDPIEQIAGDWLAAEEELSRGSGNPEQAEINARELSARYDDAIRTASREDLRLAWEAARQLQSATEMGSEAWASARRLSELLRGEYLALTADPAAPSTD